MAAGSALTPLRLDEMTILAGPTARYQEAYYKVKVLWRSSLIKLIQNKIIRVPDVVVRTSFPDFTVL